MIQSIQSDDFGKENGFLDFEKIRIDLRELIKFLIDGSGVSSIYTNLCDDVLSVKEGEPIDPAYDFEDYRLKVNRYVENNRDNLAIFKLRNNIPITAGDYKNLEHILTGELGSKEDYMREFGNTPFGLMIRKVAKLEHQAAIQVFSEFISDQSLNQTQIVFVKKIIDYVVENGYVENM